MKKIFSFLMLFALIAVACEKETTTDYQSAIKLDKTTAEFGRSGGSESIKFTIENSQGGNVTAEESAEWMEAVVEFNSEVVITVAKNEGEAREAVVTLKYEYAKEVTITVTQEANNASQYDVEFVANRFEGIYFGTEYSATPNYYVILSDIGAKTDGSPKANGTYYFFDMYHSTVADEELPILPNGDYKYDSTNSYANLTFSEEGSWYAVMDADGEYAKSGEFKTASVAVTDGRFEAIVELTSGEVHKVVFEGKLQTTIGHVLSTLVEDVEFAVEGATITASLLGDSDGDGQQNWFIEAKKGDDLFMVDVFNASVESCAGLYQMMDIEGADYANRYLPGLIGEDGLVGSWYAKLSGGTIKGDVMAPMGEGAIRIVVEGDSLTIEYGCKDDAGNNITGSVAGTVTVKDLRE